jgi:hypothetical protein
MKIETTYDLEHHLAVAQFKHYLHGHRSAMEQGDVECWRHVELLDRLVKEYGVNALREAIQGESDECRRGTMKLDRLLSEYDVNVHEAQGELYE